MAMTHMMQIEPRFSPEIPRPAVVTSPISFPYDLRAGRDDDFLTFMQSRRILSILGL